MEQFDYIQAAKGSRIMDRSQEDRAEMVRVAVTRAYELRGMPTPSGSDLQFIINEAEKKIASMYPYMTGQELTILTEQGVAGELTRDTKPTASAIFGWMAAYMTSDARKEALRNYQRNLHWNGDQHGPSEDEVAELNRQAEVRALRTLWAEFKTHGRILETEHFRGYVAMAMDGFEGGAREPQALGPRCARLPCRRPGRTRQRGQVGHAGDVLPGPRQRQLRTRTTILKTQPK